MNFFDSLNFQGGGTPPDYRFPVVTVSDRQVLRHGWDITEETFTPTLVGEGFAFDYWKLRTIAQCKHLTLDELVTGFLARGFRAHPIKSPTLVAAERWGSQFRITFSVRNHCAFAWMAGLPAFICSGGVYFGLSPVWIGLWDGATYFRAHDLSPELEGAPYLIQDFGAKAPVPAPAAPKRYFELARKPVAACQISALPHARALRIREGSSEIVVPQCRLRISPGQSGCPDSIS